MAFRLIFLFPFYGLCLERHNIIIFLVDDMSITDMSVPMFDNSENEIVAVELNKFFRTPNLALLAKQGIGFNQFYAHSVYSPSCISLLTG